MRFPLFVLIASLCHLAFSVAQEPPQRTCRILFLAAPADAPKTLFLSAGGIAQEIELPSMNFSKVYDLPPGDITLSMHTAKPVPDEPLPAAAPKAVVRKAQHNLYLLVASDPANPIAPVSFQVINADANGFKNGQLLWFNLSPHRIGGKIGSQTLNLAPNAKAILKAPADQAGDYNVRIGYVPTGTERAEPLCETVWLHDPRTKNVVFVLPVADSRIPRIMGFPDYREAEGPVVKP